MFKFRLFLRSKSANNVCKLFQLLGDPLAIVPVCLKCSSTFSDGIGDATSFLQSCDDYTLGPCSEAASRVVCKLVVLVVRSYLAVYLADDCQLVANSD